MRASSIDAAMRAKLLAAMPGLKERAKTLIELVDGAHSCSPSGRSRSTTRRRNSRRRAGAPISPRLAPLLAALDGMDRRRDGSGRARLRRSRRLKLGQVAQPLRAALTGRATSPGIFDVLEVLGRDESLGAICGPGRLSGRRATAFDWFLLNDRSGTVVDKDRRINSTAHIFASLSA